MASTEGSVSRPSNSFTSNQISPLVSSYDPAIITKARNVWDLAASRPHIALQQIQDLCDEHSHIGLLFKTQAKILEKCYDEATALDKKERIMENAIQCARKAISLSPNSMDFSSFLGHLFYRSSVEADGYKKAIEQFNTALNIPRPSDPAKETLLTDEEIQSRFPTYKARIEDARKCILKHIGDCVLMLKELKAYPFIKECLQIVEVNDNEEKVHVAWYSLSLSEKRRLFEVRVVDLTSHLISLDKHYDLFSQALSFFESHRKWQFWMCSICKHKFPTSASYLDHVFRTHLRELLTKFRNTFSLMIIDWVTFIEKIKWKALDTSAVITTLEKKRQSFSSTPESSSGAGDVQSPLEKTPGEILLEERSLFNQESLLSSDSKRATLLSKIQNKLHDLVCSDWFMAFHLDMMIQRAMKKLHGFLGECLTELDLEHYCLCLLDASQLEGILRFLDEMSNFTSKALGKKSSNVDVLRVCFHDTEIEGEISVNSGSLYVSLDKYSLSKESTSGSLSKKGNNKHCSAITDDWISWICSGPLSDKHLVEWRDLEDEKTYHGKKELDKFENCLSESFKNLHELHEELAVNVTPIDVAALEVGKERGFSLQNPEADTSIQSMIHKKRKNNDSVLSESEKRILEVAVGIQQLEIILSCVSVYNYQPILLSIVKSYIREHLEGTVRNISVKKYDAATGKEEVRGSLKMKEPLVDNQESGQTSMIREMSSLKIKEPIGKLPLSADQGFKGCGTENPEDDKQDMIDTLDKHGITIGVQSVDEVKVEEMRVRTSLPLRPGPEVMEAAIVPSKIIEKKDRLFEVIHNEERPQHIPKKQFKSLTENQRNFLLYLIDEEKRTGHLLGLEKIHAQIEDPSFGRSSDVGSDAGDVKQGHFAVIAMDAGKPKRYVIPVDYVNHPTFQRLLKQAEDEYGFNHKGPLTLPCTSTEIETILRGKWKL